MTADAIHTCSYSCDRPGCIKAQRDELRERLSALDRPSPTEAEVLAAAKRAAAANSSMHEGCDLELFWRLLDERAQAHWLKVARAVLGCES
jgi:hypothetical protein